jgi:hypothetical protein
MTNEIIVGVSISIITGLLSYISTVLFRIQKKVDLLEFTITNFKDDFKGINFQLENLDKRMNNLDIQLTEHKFSIKRNTQLWRDHSELLEKNRSNIIDLQKTIELLNQKCELNHARKKD